MDGARRRGAGRSAMARVGKGGMARAGRVQAGAVVPFADGLLRSQELPAIIAECRPKGEHAAVEFTMFFCRECGAAERKKIRLLHLLFTQKSALFF